MIRLLMATAAVATLMACAPDLNGYNNGWLPPAGQTPPDVAPPSAGGGPCNADPAQGLVGRQVSQDLAAEAMRLTHATEFRWIPPNSAVTMDYRETRLNIEYDETRAVTAIRCG